ncbi:FAD-dependent oxidoreductase [Pseudomonas sp. PCH199]|uniref:FAD-dependent oxidoreductase n=1 Tax=unclassified Pseudomonas TaxID=196821 RepID=UPI000BD339AB|nr:MULTISPECIES: FAD-dependent oxidoreductase [unclassified Pseudomonas]MCW8277481.1 FAD-dependent oxidoreductase [Pseudomonas sp. PCH199]PAM82414.1 hypothetical protein CES87_19545 [Pseudomonas sp. ERMR1:02]
MTTQDIYYDPASVAGKAPPISDETDILIVGAGPAGLAAALAAAGHGLRVTLVDENPVPIETMGEEVPLHFGGRMGAAVSNHNSVLQSLLDARPQIAEALEAGVDVRLGTAVWGCLHNNPPRRGSRAPLLASPMKKRLAAALQAGDRRRWKAGHGPRV